MGYKVNDEVLIKARIKDMSYVDTMYVCELVTEPNVCIRFKSPSECIVTDKTYTDGLNDAWKLADKVYEMRNQQRYDVFGTESLAKVMDLSPQEALAKIEAHERTNEIKVGDVIKYDNNLCVAVSVFNSTLNAMFADGGTINVFISQCKKTGKHIDIESLLKEIGE